eukprot:1184979-Pyramimonas_sp.AAC.1
MDIAAAFPSLNHAWLWEILSRWGSSARATSCPSPSSNWVVACARCSLPSLASPKAALLSGA